jgi:mono/diheme cytochrome c family protein
MPPMDSHRGREIFLNKGCVVCHAVNGVGGEVGPSFDAADMPRSMNAFEFAARMWRSAPAMALMLEEELGGFIDLTGEELADLIAFVHDANEQQELTADQIPDRFHSMTE